MIKKLGILLTCLLIMATSQAQGVITKAHIHYKMADLKSSDPQVMAHADMMGGDLLIYFDENNMRTDVAMGQGLMKMSTFVLKNGDQAQNYMYLDMMGSKIKVKMSTEELESFKSQEDYQKPEITVSADDIKTILGYECKKVTAIVKAKDNPDVKVIAYVTNKIKAPQSIIQDMGELTFNGLPLEYSIVTPDMTLVYRAEKILQDILDSDLEQPQGYQEMDFSQFAGSMGGMFGK